MNLSPAARNLLSALDRAEGELHGYEIMQAINSTSGTVYPLLRRFTEAGLVICRAETEEELIASVSNRPRRKFYTITNAGRELVRGLRKE